MKSLPINPGLEFLKKEAKALRAQDAESKAESVQSLLDEITRASANISAQVEKAVSVAEYQQSITSTATEKLQNIKEHIDSTAEVTEKVADIAMDTSDVADSLAKEISQFTCAEQARK